jgi:dCMP deaminase
MNWDEYLMGMARAASLKSKDTTKVGCVIVGTGNEILTTGFNDHPRGVLDLPERRERPAKYWWTSHAEENAIAQAARSGTRLHGGTAYVTLHPCARCARALIQAGIRCVVVGPDASVGMDAIDFAVASQMLVEAMVVVREYE